MWNGMKMLNGLLSLPLSLCLYVQAEGLLDEQGSPGAS